MDPRVKTPAAGLLQQFTLATKITSMMHQDYQALQEARGLEASETASLAKLNGDMVRILETVEGADATPTTQTVAAVAELERTLQDLLGRLRARKATAKETNR